MTEQEETELRKEITKLYTKSTSLGIATLDLVEFIKKNYISRVEAHDQKVDLAMKLKDKDQDLIIKFASKNRIDLSFGSAEVSLLLEDTEKPEPKGSYIIS